MSLAYQSPSKTVPPSGFVTTADGAEPFAMEAAHIQRLEERGLDAELAARLGVKASRRLNGDCIAIPYIFNGDVVGTKYRTLGDVKTFATNKGFTNVFWNADCLADTSLKAEPLIITEGELDAIAAIQCGFPRVVSIPSGAPTPDEDPEGTGRRYECVERAAAQLRDVREIILAVDGDEAGARLLHALSVRLGRHRCKYVRYPAETKDLNEILALYGQSAVSAAITGAQWLKVDGVFKLSELPPLSLPPALPTGILELEQHYRLRVGDFVVVTGLPGHGKTSLVNEVVCRMALGYKWNAVWCSLEQTPQIDHKRVLRSFHASKAVRAMSAEEKAAADAWIDDRFAFIVPNEDEDMTLKWFLEKAAAAVIRHNAKIVVLDPWNELDHSRPSDMTGTEYVGFAIRQFKRFAKKYQVHLIVVAHPAKMLRAKDGKYPIPGLYDISDSAHWANKADLGIVVHRENVMASNEATIAVVKSRYHNAIGRPGAIKGVWHEDSSRFTIMNGQ